MAEFVCNICGKRNAYSGEAFEREKPGCGSCGSTLRTRALMGALSMELFGIRLSLADFPDVSGEDMRGRFCFIVPQVAFITFVAYEVPMERAPLPQAQQKRRTYPGQG